jgi:hypothetical protein
VNLPGELTGEIEVWALSRSLRSPTALSGSVGGKPVQLEVSEPPQATNANLHAQSGLFTISEFYGDVVRGTDEVVEGIAEHNPHLGRP